MFAVVVDDAERGVVWAARIEWVKTALRRQRRFGPGACVGFHERAQSLHAEDHALNRFDRDAARFLAYDFVPDSEGILKASQRSARERSDSQPR